jgi:hypothetical protein
VPSRFYRIIRGPEATVQDFLSDRARGQPEPADPAYRELWDGLSVFATETQARNKAQDWEIGDHLALLEIPDDAPVRWKRTLKSRGHHTLWGDPSYLLGRVVSIVAV